MKNNLILLGMLIAVGGVVGYSQLLQRAQAFLSPEQLLAIVKVKRPWWDTFIPVIPLLAAYMLLPVFPEHQAFVAVPALLISVGLVVKEFSSSARRAEAMELPATFVAARSRANAVLAVALLAGMGLVAWARHL
jgi:hypothetical protein